MIVDRNTLASYFDLSPGRITQLCHEGVLSKVSRNRFDAPVCIQEYIAFRVQGGQSGTRDVTAARTRLYSAQTTKVELENEKTLENSIPANEHLQDMLAFQEIADAALNDIGEPLANDLAGLCDPAAIAARLAHATNAVRTVVADEILVYAGTLEG